MFKCPKCGSRRKFKIMTTCPVDQFVDSDGNVVDVDYFDPEGPELMECRDCEYEAEPTNFVDWEEGKL